ncbi:uncharacterized protein LOC142235015 [Haematobia irritans]|uniref:uncharacterized protein LOC142235015 n=1 Tax=Haematobia irritans TaxID=7368 RepID=UPI003F508043
MKFIIFTLFCSLLGHTVSIPLESSSNDATETLVEIEKQRLIKFPEDLDEAPNYNTGGAKKTDEAKRILEEIEKINQALGYVKKSDHARLPAILDSSQYLFPNTGYQPFHAQNPQTTGSNGETLLVPSIRSVKFDQVYHHKASDYNKPPLRKVSEATVKPIAKPSIKPPAATTSSPQFYFHPARVEVPKPETPEEQKLLPTHFVIPVRLYKNNKKQYIEKHSPQEYKVKGYKIVGDIDHFYGKTKSVTASKVKSSPKYHLLFLPQEVVPKNSATDIVALDSDPSSAETSSREEKLAKRPLNLQTNTQATSNGNIVNATSSATIVRKRVKPPRGEGQTVLSVTSASVIKVTPAPTTTGGVAQKQPQNQQQLSQQNQHQLAQQQSQYTKPGNGRPNNHPLPVGTPAYLANPQPTAGGSNGQSIPPNNENNNIYNNNNNDNPGNTNSNKNRPFLNPLLSLQSNIQSNINNINNATSTAIRNAFQNIFRLPLRPDNTNDNNDNRPSASGNDYTYPYLQPTLLQLPQKQQQQLQQQQQYVYTLVSPANSKPPVMLANPIYQSDHLDSDYKWDDENSSMDSDSSDERDAPNATSNDTQEPPEEKFLGHHPIREIHNTQKEALKQGGIIIQKLKVRKGGIAIAGPGGVATAGSGGTAIVGPGGYALTHPRSLTIAGPGTKVIAIPANVDLKDALTRTNIHTKMIPREGRIVATGPTVYYAPGTADGVEID